MRSLTDKQYTERQKIESEKLTVFEDLRKSKQKALTDHDEFRWHQLHDLKLKVWQI